MDGKVGAFRTLFSSGMIRACSGCGVGSPNFALTRAVKDDGKVNWEKMPKSVESYQELLKKCVHECLVNCGESRCLVLNREEFYSNNG